MIPFRLADLWLRLWRANIAAALAMWCPPPRKPEPPAKPRPPAMDAPIFRPGDWDQPSDGDTVVRFRRHDGGL
jgi:hypothetical protein